MTKLRAVLENVGRIIVELARRTAHFVGDWSIELAGVGALALLLGYATWGPSRVRLLEVGATVIVAPSWVVALLVLLLIAVVFWLVVSQLED